MKLSTNFSLAEFASKDGSDFPPEVIDNLKELAVNLQVLRDEIKKPIQINSGYRSPAHNKSIGGAKNSTHVKGLGADIRVNGVSPNKLFQTVERLVEAGKIKTGGLKAYNSFLHIDIRGVKARW
ncbi:DUF882 domain-containing protein [Litoribacter alkaliphilus]|uniref:DUF882 domain-containing protein n=1 Tax=Litoribacter ruber TaxID=702568 RepID=A0AAP2G6C4_9BACT|nr:D-Ala-D-Ala carboxypeptidase family metallohydrolase [Litoribacter alkaliphilus]MBS9525921.1 DUF882 domain-containing protein [Litoribacter alkaliphilus]